MVSAYNILCKKDDQIFAFNSLSGKFLKIAGKNVKEFQDVLQNEGNTGRMQEILLRDGFLVESEEKEKEKFLELESKIINNRNQLSLIILPTEKCNFRCEYCYEENRAGGMEQKTIDSLISFVENKLVNYDSLNVEWFGGEPLIAQPVIYKISLAFIEICKKMKKPYSAGMTTNGYYLTPKMVQELKKIRIVRYQITLDGMGNTHDRLRFLSSGEGTWKVIVRNLMGIRDYIQSSMITVVIRTNLTKEIYKDIDRYIGFIQTEFAGDNRFSFLFRAAADWGGSISNSIKESFISKDEYMAVIKKALQKKLKLHYFRSVLQPGGLLCYSWKRGIYVVNPTGEFVRCTLKIKDTFDIEKLREEEYYSIGHPDICKKCRKLPICLKTNCNFSGQSEELCEYDIENLEEILPYLESDYYGCTLYGE